MFTSSKQFKSNLKLYFFNDKELLAMGSNNESVVLPVLDCLDNPKAVAPRTNIFSMSKKNIFVTNTLCVQVTPAQNELLKLLNHPNAADFASSLRLIHGLGTYAVDEDMVSPSSSYHTHLLLDAINAIAVENTINKLKN